jgi:hypothetical protein
VRGQIEVDRAVALFARREVGDVEIDDDRPGEEG